MLRPLFFILVLLSTSLTFSQKGVFVGGSITIAGVSDLIQFQSLDGTEWYDNDEFRSVSLFVSKNITGRFSMEGGLNWSSHNMFRMPNVPPTVDALPIPVDFQHIYVSLYARYTFLKVLFIQGGPLLGIHSSNKNGIDSQTGIGLGLGVGLDVDIVNKLSLFALSFVNQHAIISASSATYPFRLNEMGIRAGISFKL